MKILYVDLQYDYGIKSRGKNYIGQDGFRKSFERLGHEVVSFYYDELLYFSEKLQLSLCEFADNVNPDLIFFCLFKDQFKPETLSYLKSKYKTINWFGDDQWRFDNFTRKYAPYFTWCITTDKFAISKYKNIGQNNVVYSQWAAINEHEAMTFDGQYLYDVTFVGGFHPYRHWFINKLIKCGISVETFGNGWPNGPLTSSQMNSVFMASKINLNLSNSSSTNLSYMFSSPRCLLSVLRSKKLSSQIKARNFEIAYFGGFQLSDYVPTLEEYFEIGKQIACYTTPKEAAVLIRYYLDNDSEREAIRKAGQKRAISEHGYFQRLKKILKEIS